MFPGETILSGANSGKFGTNGYSDIQVMSSAAGWYLGTTYDHMPGTRETSYFRFEKDAEEALRQWKDGKQVFARSTEFRGN